MFGWIRRMYDAVAGDIDETVRRWVHDLVNGLYGLLHLIFGDVGKAWNVLVNAILLAWRAVDTFTEAVWYKLWIILRSIIPAVIREYRRLIHDVNVYAHDVLNWAQRAISSVEHAIERGLRDVENWVIRDIWNPLKSAFDTAWHWITHEGAVAWYYISHPADLAALLFDHLIAKLEADAWSVAERLGKFALSLVVRNLPRFAKLAEDIIDAIL